MPLDLVTVSRRLSTGDYGVNPGRFAAEVRRVFSNAKDVFAAPEPTDTARAVAALSSRFDSLLATAVPMSPTQQVQSLLWCVLTP